MGVEPDDIIGELHRLRQYAAGLRDSVAQAQASAPRSTEAADRSGAVRLVLGADGLPESILVDADWRRRLQPAAFGAAVVEAFQVAAGERMTAWSGARDRSRAEPAGEQQTDEQQPDVAGPLPESRSPRPLGELADDMMRALDGVQEMAAAMPTAVTGTGSGGSGRLVVTLSRFGLVSCTADARWASTQSGAALTAALHDALAVARAALTDAVSVASATGPVAGLDRLVTDALAILADPRLLTDPLRFTDPQHRAHS